MTKIYRKKSGIPFAEQELQKYKPIAIMLISLAREQGLDVEEFNLVLELAGQVVVHNTAVPKLPNVI